MYETHINTNIDKLIQAYDCLWVWTYQQNLWYYMTKVDSNFGSIYKIIEFKFLGNFSKDKNMLVTCLKKVTFLYFIAHKIKPEHLNL